MATGWNSIRKKIEIQLPFVMMMRDRRRTKSKIPFVFVFFLFFGEMRENLGSGRWFVWLSFFFSFFLFMVIIMYHQYNRRRIRNRRKKKKKKKKSRKSIETKDLIILWPAAACGENIYLRIVMNTFIHKWNIPAKWKFKKTRKIKIKID
jgi:hypothetical protein